jgi:hypothetical protein
MNKLLISILLACLAPFASAASITDDFNRSDGGIGTGYTTLATMAEPQIVGNRLESGTVGAVDGSKINTAFGNDHYIQFTDVNGYVGSTNRRLLAFMLRHSSGGYYGFYIDNDPVDVTLKITVHDGVSETTLVSDTESPSDGNTWRAEVEGTAIRLIKNGVLRLSATDSEVASGDSEPIAFYFYGNPNGSMNFDNLAAGDISSSSSPLLKIMQMSANEPANDPVYEIPAMLARRTR